jgi:hypothetical protein
MFSLSLATKPGPLSLLMAAVSVCSVTGCGSSVANPLAAAIRPAVAPSGPILGYIFSGNDGTLRALLGVRGSARISASIVPPGVYVAGETSAASSSGLLEDASGSLFAFALPQTVPTHVIDGLPANAKITFSSSGQTAVAYSVGGSNIVLITGLPTTPQVQTIKVPANRSPISATVSDDGTIVLVSSGSPMPVGRLAANGAFSTFTTVVAIGGLSFIPGSDDVLIADNAANTISLIHNVSNSPSSQPLNVTGLNHPVAVSASLDKNWAIIANGGDAGVLRVNLTNSTTAAKVLCACQPSQLSMLSGGGVFRVNSLYSGPVWMIDITTPTPQLLFVPAIVRAPS